MSTNLPHNILLLVAARLLPHLIPNAVKLQHCTTLYSRFVCLDWRHFELTRCLLFSIETFNLHKQRQPNDVTATTLGVVRSCQNKGWPTFSPRQEGWSAFQRKITIYRRVYDNNFQSERTVSKQWYREN